MAMILHKLSVKRLDKSLMNNVIEGSGQKWLIQDGKVAKKVGMKKKTYFCHSVLVHALLALLDS